MGPLEKEEGAVVSEKTLASEVVLCEWVCR